MIAEQSHGAHSAQVNMRLMVNGTVIRITHMGPDFIFIESPADYPPCQATISLSVNDRELARRLRRPKHEVRSQRIALHIQPLLPRRSRRWTRREEKLLGTMPDRELAARLRRSFMGVYIHRQLLGIPNPSDRQRPFTPQEDALLGTGSDSKIARRLGRSRSTVMRRRRRLGLPSFVPTSLWTQED